MGSLNLKQQIYTSEMVHRLLPKQIDLNKVIKLSQRDALKGTHLPWKKENTFRIYN